MKKSLMLVGMLTMVLSYAQEGRVGINTENPNATLEVAGTGNKKVVDGIIAPRLHGWELRQKGTDVYGEAQKGAIVYMITAVENPAYRQGQLVNITTPGYYYFDGTVWVKFNPTYTAGNGIAINDGVISATGENANIYTNDGTLTGNRTVTMDNKSLNFAGGKVGVNTANPTTSLDITSSAIGGGFRLADGSQEKGKVLTAGVDGRASWEWPTSPMQVFDLRSVKNLTIPAGSKDLHYTGIQLLLQPGKWVTTISLGVTHNASPSFRIGGTFLRLRLLSQAQATNDVIAGAGSGGMLHPNAISSKFASLLIPFNARQSTLTGTLDVENNTNAPIRVYVYADIAATEGGNVDGNQTTLMFDWNESSLSTTEVR